MRIGSTRKRACQARLRTHSIPERPRAGRPAAYVVTLVSSLALTRYACHGKPGIGAAALPENVALCLRSNRYCGLRWLSWQQCA